MAPASIRRAAARAVRQTASTGACPRSQLGPAPQAGPKPLALGQGRVGEKPAPGTAHCGPCKSDDNKSPWTSPRRKTNRRSGHHARPGLDSTRLVVGVHGFVRCQLLAVSGPWWARAVFAQLGTVYTRGRGESGHFRTSRWIIQRAAREAGASVAEAGGDVVVYPCNRCNQ